MFIRLCVDRATPPASASPPPARRDVVQPRRSRPRSPSASLPVLPGHRGQAPIMLPAGRNFPAPALPPAVFTIALRLRVSHPSRRLTRQQGPVAADSGRTAPVGACQQQNGSGWWNRTTDLGDEPRELPLLHAASIRRAGVAPTTLQRPGTWSSPREGAPACCIEAHRTRLVFLLLNYTPHGAEETYLCPTIFVTAETRLPGTALRVTSARPPPASPAKGFWYGFRSRTVLHVPAPVRKARLTARSDFITQSHLCQSVNV